MSVPQKFSDTILKLSAAVFCSTLFSLLSIFVPRNETTSCFLFMEGSEQNLESFFYFCSREFRDVLSSVEGFRTEFESFLFRNSMEIIHLFRLFRLPRNHFLAEIPNPTNNNKKAWSSLLILALHDVMYVN